MREVPGGKCMLQVLAAVHMILRNAHEQLATAGSGYM